MGYTFLTHPLTEHKPINIFITGRKVTRVIKSPYLKKVRASDKNPIIILKTAIIPDISKIVESLPEEKLIPISVEYDRYMLHFQVCEWDLHPRLKIGA